MQVRRIGVMYTAPRGVGTVCRISGYCTVLADSILNGRPCIMSVGRVFQFIHSLIFILLNGLGREPFGFRL